MQQKSKNIICKTENSNTHGKLTTINNRNKSLLFTNICNCQESSLIEESYNQFQSIGQSRKCWLDENVRLGGVPDFRIIDQDNSPSHLKSI